MSPDPNLAMPLPASLAYGKVVGRVISASGDTAADGDTLPEGVAAQGTITFTPDTTYRVAPDQAGTQTYVAGAPIACTFDESGYIKDAAGALGVWLVTGVYKVNLKLNPVGPVPAPTVPEFKLEVSTAHTGTSPLQVFAAVPPVGGEDVTVYTVSIPTGGSTGQVLTRTPSGTAWTTPSGGGGGGAVTSADILDATTVGKALLTAAGSLAARAVIGAGTSNFDGAYASLTGKPTIPSSAADIGAATAADITAAIAAGRLGWTANITDPTNQKVSRVIIEDDATASGSWANRMEFFYKPKGGSQTLTGYANEFGELRSRASRANSVALRAITFDADGTTQTGNIFEVCSGNQANQYLQVAKDKVTISVPLNMPGKTVTALNAPVVSTTPPASPAVGQLWVDIS